MTNAADGAPMATQPPLTMPIEEAMRTQRALRRLKPDPVDDALVLHLIEFALKAPTGRNAQNWEFVLVKDYAVKVRLARLYRIAWSIYGRSCVCLGVSPPVPWCRWAGRWDGMGRRPAVPSAMSSTSIAMATSRSRPRNPEGAM